MRRLRMAALLACAFAIAVWVVGCDGDSSEADRQSTLYQQALVEQREWYSGPAGDHLSQRYRETLETRVDKYLGRGYAQPVPDGYPALQHYEQLQREQRERSRAVMRVVFFWVMAGLSALALGIVGYEVYRRTAGTKP